jgi:peptidoglycan hydrolase-like protein with peptidoglycan-binding domain
VRASRTTVAVAAGAGFVVAAGITAIAIAIASGGHPAGAGHGPTAAGRGHAAGKITPVRVLSVTPANGSRGIKGTGQVKVTFAARLPDGMPYPRLSPSIAGTWRREGNAAIFTPRTGFTGTIRVRVTVPRAVTGARSDYTTAFTTAGYSTLRLQQLLAELGYLPMNWTDSLGFTDTPGSAGMQLDAAYAPPAGSFSPHGGYPRQLWQFWKQGAANLLQAGAVTGFEADHGLPTDGQPGPAVWAALLKAAARDQHNAHGYSYAIASQGSPETLTIWHDGRQVFSSLANTGISIAPTPTGTFPVYEKLPYQVMQGTNPDGSHYADPVQWVSYFSGGSAVHYIPRGSYGYPQSLGCVELPYTAAEESYRYLPYGSLVTVG